MSEQPDAIIHYQEDKLYLKPERIIPTQNGLFLYDNNSAIRLAVVFSDQQGCYIRCVQYDELAGFYKCTNKDCNNVWDPNRSRKCPKCGSPGKLFRHNNFISSQISLTEIDLAGYDKSKSAKSITMVLDLLNF